jgi:hypothetical protein
MKATMTNKLPAEIMENGIHYTLVGDYYFPTCMLADRSPNGKWDPCMSAICRRSIRTSMSG